MSESHAAPSPADDAAHERWVAGRRVKVQKVAKLLQKIFIAASDAKKLLDKSGVGSDAEVIHLSIEEIILLSRYLDSVRDHLHRMGIRSRDDMKRLDDILVGRDI